MDFNRDYFRPFANRFAAAIREINPQTLIFVETIPEYPACASRGCGKYRFSAHGMM
jgi:hypothetical protein